MLLVLLMTMATASLSASFAVFLVRERANKSKHVQTVSGAPPTAFWASVYLWDLINYAISAAGQASSIMLFCCARCGVSLPVAVPAFVLIECRHCCFGTRHSAVTML